MQPSSSAQQPPAPMAERMDLALARLAELTDSDAIRALKGNELLMERAWLSGARFSNGRSSSGATRLLTTTDGVLAITLARPDDWALLPAWLETDNHETIRLLEAAAAQPSDSAWRYLATEVRSKCTAELLEQGRTLGLPVAAAGAHRQKLTPEFSSLFVGSGGNPAPRRPPPRVVDLSALWAGPLCSHLLRLAGAEVIKVESLSRPDGARAGHAGFYQLLNQGKHAVALNLSCPEGIKSLEQLIESADILIESSRPRALRQLGIRAEQILAKKPDLIWLSLTGYGRSEPQASWTAFGDDAGVAAGLSDLMAEATGAYQIAGDAIADPLTGTHAAVAAWQAYVRGRGGLIEMALTDVAAWCLNESARTLPELNDVCRRWWQKVGNRPPPANYVGREIRVPAAELGRDTEAVLAKLNARC